MEEKKLQKPDWIKALEAQSWQAELIASGLAIYGSISLGTYLDDLVQWILLYANQRTLNILYFLLIYVYAGHALLVVSFITHLILRILWTGILGLSSVFPMGINLKTSTYSEDFKTKLKRDFPDLTEYSISLDKLCSLIFSILCALVIILFSISFWLSVYLVFSNVMVSFLPSALVNLIGYGLLSLLLIISTISGVLTQTRFKESKLADKYGYKLTLFFSKVFYLFGYKAVTYITQTIRTNINSKSFFLGMFSILMVSMFLSLPRFFNYVPYFMQDAWVDHNARPDQVKDEHYADAVKSTFILEPIIQKRVIDASYIDLFIPRYRKEQPLMLELCGSYDRDDQLSEQENIEGRLAHRRDCANQYYTVYLDDQKLEDLNFARQRHPNQGEVGYQAYVNIDSLDLGRHYLRISSRFEAEGARYRRTIPFYKSGN